MSRNRFRRKLPGDVNFPHVRSFWAAVMLVIGLVLIFGAMADPQSGIIAPPSPIARLFSAPSDRLSGVAHLFRTPTSVERNYIVASGVRTALPQTTPTLMRASFAKSHDSQRDHSRVVKRLTDLLTLRARRRVPLYRARTATCNYRYHVTLVWSRPRATSNPVILRLGDFPLRWTTTGTLRCMCLAGKEFSGFGEVGSCDALFEPVVHPERAPGRLPAACRACAGAGTD